MGAWVYYRTYFEKWMRISAGRLSMSLVVRRSITFSLAFRFVQLLVSLSLNLLRFDSGIVDVWFAQLNVSFFPHLSACLLAKREHKKMLGDNSNLFIVGPRKRNTIASLEERKNRRIRVTNHQHTYEAPGELDSARWNVWSQITEDYLSKLVFGRE